MFQALFLNNNWLSSLNGGGNFADLCTIRVWSSLFYLLFLALLFGVVIIDVAVVVVMAMVGVCVHICSVCMCVCVCVCLCLCVCACLRLCSCPTRHAILSQCGFMQIFPS